jgi:hypothetical protein
MRRDSGGLDSVDDVPARTQRNSAAVHGVRAAGEKFWSDIAEQQLWSEVFDVAGAMSSGGLV